MQEEVYLQGVEVVEPGVEELEQDASLPSQSSDPGVIVDPPAS